jgi:hypothetical protein
MAVIFTCPGVGETAPSVVLHMYGCCIAFAQLPIKQKQVTGLRYPAPELTHEAMCLREEAVDLLVDVAAGKVWWVIQRTGTYGHVGGRRCTKLLRGLVAAGLATVPESSGYCLPTDLGLAALGFHRPAATAAERCCPNC